MKVSGEGNDQPKRPEDELPIDINYAKLYDWLSDRQKVKGDWRTKLQLIRQKVATAIENLPDNPQLNAVKAGINVDEVSFYHVKKIRDVLTTDADTAKKNWLGQYKNQATKDWEAILKLYGRDNVHLAEAAQVLGQNVQYEIPALRKVVQGCQRQQQELHRKEAEYKRVSGEYAAAFEKECGKLGIKGQEVRGELLERSKELPKIYGTLVQAVRGDGMVKALEMYAAFVEHSGCGEIQMGLVKGMQQGEVPSEAELEAIAFADDAVSFEDMQAMLGGGGGGGGGIDWGGDAGDAGGGIDFGDDGVGGGDASASGGGGIDFGDDIDWGDSGGGGAGGGIDFGGIEVEGGDAGGDGIDWGADLDVEIEVEGGGEEATDMMAGGAECLKSASGRASLVNELLELQSFLRMRGEEIRSTEYVAVDTSADLPQVCQVSGSVVDSMLKSCQESISLVNSPLTQQLIMLRSSSRFLNRLTTSLEQRLENSKKMAGCIQTCIKRRAELDETISSTQPKVDGISRATRSIKQCAEDVLTEMMMGRRVNIIGDINSVCSGA